MKHPWRYDAIAKRIAYPLTAVCKYFIKVKGQAQSQNNIRKEMSCLRPGRARPKMRLIAPQNTVSIQLYFLRENDAGQLRQLMNAQLL
jgi:hypothetical protein